jgi:hypothetical protein
MPGNSPSPFPGYITPFAAKVLPYLSPWKLYAAIVKADPTDRPRHAKLVEKYIAAWIAIVSVHAAILGCTYDHSAGAGWLLAAVLPCCRIVDIVQANFVRHILMAEADSSGRGEPASVSRVILLAIFNYAELIFAFAVVYASASRLDCDFGVSGARTVRDFVYFSGVTQLTIGYGELSPTGAARPVALFQAMVGLALTVFIFARFASSFRSPLERRCFADPKPGTTNESH